MPEPVSLQARVEQLCAEFPGIAGVAAGNLATGEEVSVNARLSFPTASMIKIQILFELVRLCARGQAQMWERVTLRREDKTLGSGLLVDLDDGLNLTLRDLAVLMMSISDNTATNILIDRLGRGAINAACRDAGMYDTELRGKIDFDRIRESNDNLAVSTPHDFRTFLSALHRGELIPGPYVEQILGIMRIQKYIEPMRKPLPFNPYGFEFGEPQEVWVASKTGSLKGVRCESGLVHTPRATWALSVCTKECEDNSWTSDNTGVRFISAVSRALYEVWG
ncbi:MAG TPA: serine hydrolase [Armatimonadota bacterium]|nr:serine hydrolase [Armatimonadota bacterium]